MRSEDPKQRQSLISNLLKGAEDDALAFDACAAAAAEYWDTGTRDIDGGVRLTSVVNVDMPPELKRFGLNFLRGNLSEPRAKPGPKAVQNHLRNCGIIIAVDALVEKGMIATRNDASTSYSACDQVAERLNKDHGLNISLQAVKKIWSEEFQTLPPYLTDPRVKN